MRSLPLLILAALLSLLTYAQNPVPGIEMPKVVSPSPEAASLGKFGDVPVSLYNGIPSINIPLYSIPIDGNALSLSLSYTGNSRCKPCPQNEAYTMRQNEYRDINPNSSSIMP